jgi:hypothetical protein
MSILGEGGSVEPMGTYLDGRDWYAVFSSTLAAHNIEIDSWDELDVYDQAGWEAVADEVERLR